MNILVKMPQPDKAYLNGSISLSVSPDLCLGNLVHYGEGTGADEARTLCRRIKKAS